MLEFTDLTVSSDGPLGRITLSRPQRLNAITRRTLEELLAAVTWFDDRPDVRAVILDGAGRAFCSGFDVTTLADGGETDTWERRYELADLGRRAMDALENIEAVTIASLHGHVVGGGFVLAAACDLRIAATGTRFRIPEVDLAIPLSWGGMPRLVGAFGPAIAKELVMTASTLEADDAFRLGFLNRVTEESDRASAAVELATAVATRPKVPVAITKRHVNAITRQAGGGAFAFADAAALVSSLTDPEAAAMRARYAEEVTGSDGS